MTAADSSTAEVSVRGNLVIGIASIAAGAVVIPYGATMPYIREGIPGPGLFPMMIGGLLILFGALVLVTSLLSVRRARIHGEQMAVAEAQAPPAGAAEVENGPAAAGTSVVGTSGAETSGAESDAVTSGAETSDAETSDAATSGAVTSGAGTSDAETVEASTSAPAADERPGVPADADDVPEDEMATRAVMDTDIGSDGIRRWINGAILMGGIVFFVLFAEILGFPLTMAILVTSIVWSLRAKWWAAVLTGVLTSLGLWLMFEQGLLVQLPDGPFRGF